MGVHFVKSNDRIICVTVAKFIQRSFGDAADIVFRQDAVMGQYYVEDDVGVGRSRHDPKIVDASEMAALVLFTCGSLVLIGSM